MSVAKIAETQKAFNHNFVLYSIGLIRSVGKKSCVAMSRVLNLRHDKLLRGLCSKIELLANCRNPFVIIANSLACKAAGWIIIDDTLICKDFSRFIEGVGFSYDSVTGRPRRGLCVVCLVWTNGHVTIPIAFRFWLEPALAQAHYKTKSLLAQELILQYKRVLRFEYFLADGLYCTVEMLKFLRQHNIHFEMRIASNRKVKKAGIERQLKNHPAFKLYGNTRRMTVYARWYGMRLAITVHKRRNRSGEYDIVYQASNAHDLDANEHVFFYEQRWEIEKMFRSMKQSLGASQCMARSIDKQGTHMQAVFCSYVFLQTEKQRLKLFCVEDALKRLQILKSHNQRCLFGRFNRIFAYVA